MSKKRSTIDGPFVPHRRVMLLSPAWRTLSLSARRVLDRIELELMAHGGNHENGRLPVTYDNFIEYGVRRNGVASAQREAVALGFIVITEQGRAGSATNRKPTQFRLTYLHSKDDPRGARLHNPTDEWRLIKTIKEAERIAAEARKLPVNPNTRTRQNQKATPRNGTDTPPEMGGGNGDSLPPEMGGEAQPPKRGVLSISPVPPAEMQQRARPATAGAQIERRSCRPNEHAHMGQPLSAVDETASVDLDVP
jgi:hypothetical protein